MNKEITPLNPSRSATKRVKNKIKIHNYCPYCNEAVILAKNDVVYGRLYGEWPWIYQCAGDCNAYVGLHPFTAIPLGTIADKNLREARKKSKGFFNQIWQSGAMTRSKCYAMLANGMGIPIEECHFGWFNLEQCAEAIRILKGNS